MGPEFWGVLPGFGGFCFCFCNLIFESGGGLVFGWAGLGWAVFLFALEFDFGILGTAGGFCFLLLLFGWAGLGWAAAGLGWALLTQVLGKIRDE